MLFGGRGTFWLYIGSKKGRREEAQKGDALTLSYMSRLKTKAKFGGLRRYESWCEDHGARKNKNWLESGRNSNGELFCPLFFGGAIQKSGESHKRGNSYESLRNHRND